MRSFFSAVFSRISPSAVRRNADSEAWEQRIQERMRTCLWMEGSAIVIHSDDLFETLCETLGRLYVSDLHREPYRTMAAEQMIAMDLNGYSPKVLSDIANYLFDEQPVLKDGADAKHYLEMKLKRPKKKRFLGKE